MFAGNSLLYYGEVVINDGSSPTQSKGVFEKIAETFGDKVKVTNFTYGSAGFTDGRDKASTNGIPSSYKDYGLYQLMLELHPNHYGNKDGREMDPFYDQDVVVFQQRGASIADSYEQVMKIAALFPEDTQFAVVITHYDTKNTSTSTALKKTLADGWTVIPAGDLVTDLIKNQGAHGLYCTSYKTTKRDIINAMAQGYLGIKPYQANCAPYIPASEIRIFDFLPHEHLEVMNDIGGIVILHIPRSMRLRDPVNLAQMQEIDERYPNAKVIIAHVGRAYVYEDIGDAFDVIKNTKNLYYDFSANVYDYAMERLIDSVGPKRVLYGSDMPYTKMRMYRINDGGKYVNVVPRGLYGDVSNDKQMRETDESDVTLFIYEELLAFRRAAEKLGLTKEDVSDIMYGNAARYLGL